MWVSVQYIHIQDVNGMHEHVLAFVGLLGLASVKKKKKKTSLLPFYTLIFAHNPLSTSRLSRRFFKLWSHSQYSVGGWKKEWHDGGLHGFHSIYLLHQTTVPIFLSVHIISTGSTWWMAWISHISPWHTCTVKILFDLSKGPIWWWALFTRPTWLSSKGSESNQLDKPAQPWSDSPEFYFHLMPSLLSPLWVESVKVWFGCQIWQLNLFSAVSAKIMGRTRSDGY